MTQSTGNSSTADVAKEQASGVADSAGAAASDVAGTAQDQASEVVAEAKTQAKDLGRQVQSEVSDHAGVQRDRVVDLLRSLGDELQQIASGQGVESGMATDFAQQISDRTRSAATFLDGKEPGELLGDLSRYARQRPGAFLVGAGIAGLLAGRLTRGITAANADDSTGSRTAGHNAADYATTPGAEFADAGSYPPPVATGVYRPVGLGHEATDYTDTPSAGYADATSGTGYPDAAPGRTEYPVTDPATYRDGDVETGSTYPTEGSRP